VGRFIDDRGGAMTGSKNLRWLLWMLLLVGLGWLVATDQRRSQPKPQALADVPPRQAKPPAPAPGPEQAPDVAVRDLIPRVRLIAKRQPGGPVTDLFASRNWAPPPAPAAPPPALLPPAAPAPPQFTYLGKRRDEGGWQVYLGRGDLALIVREGETIDGGYRVESIKPPTLTLVRADNKQQIAIGEWE